MGNHIIFRPVTIEGVDTGYEPPPEALPDPQTEFDGALDLTKPDAELDTGAFQVSPDPNAPADPAAPTEPVWDYKTATADRQGNIPLGYRFSNGEELVPLGFDPNGDVYFGSGLVGWGNKMVYKALTSYADDTAKAEEQQALINEGMTKLGDIDFAEVGKELVKNIASPGEFLDNTVEVLKGEGDGFGEIGKTASAAWDVVKGFWGTAKNIDKTASDNKVESGAKSAISGGVKLAEMGAQVFVDVFSEFAKTAQQVIGMNKVMREYVKEHGSDVNGLMEKDFDPITIWGEYKVTDELVNTFMHANPLLTAYDAVRFFAAPGTVEEKKKAFSEGWTENRMLWTELVKPSVEAEFERRLLAGENPDLLQMELQDPWVQAVGELAIDPLNIVAPFARTNKFADLVKTNGELYGVAGNAVDAFNVMSKAKTPAQMSGALDNLANTVRNFGYTADAFGNFVDRIVGKLELSGNALTAKGMIVKQSKNMSEFVTWGIGEINRASGTPDDITEMLGAMFHLASSDPNEIKQGLSYLASSKKIAAKHAFLSQQGMETAHMIRNLMGEGDAIPQLIKRLKTADPKKQAELIGNLLSDAARNQYPSIADMAAAEKRVGKLADAEGVLARIDEIEQQLKTADAATAKRLTNELADLKRTKPNAKDIRMSQEFQKIKAEHPAAVALLKFQNEVSKPISAINAIYSNIFFTSYGFVARNAMMNNVMIYMDAGIKAFFREGRFLTDTEIERRMIDLHGGSLPDAFKEQMALSQTVGEPTGWFGKKFKQYLKDPKLTPATLQKKAEYTAGLRVGYKFYQDTMESMVDLGAGLPNIERWAEKGFTPVQAEDFSLILKSNGYDYQKSREIFAKQYSSGRVELRKTLEWLPKDLREALDKYDPANFEAFVKLTKAEATTPEDISRFIDDWRTNIRHTAHQAVNEVNGLPMKDATGFLERFGGEYDELKVFREKQIHIENANQQAIEAWGADLESATLTASKKRDALIAGWAGKKPKPDELELVKQINQWIDKSHLHTKGVLDMLNEKNKILKQAKAYLDDFMSKNKTLRFGEGQREVEWRKWYDLVDREQEKYFKFYDGGGNILADDFAKLTGEDAARVFKKSRQATVDVQAANFVTADPKTGQLLHVLPENLKYSVAGDTGHKENLYQLGRAYGVKLDAPKDVYGGGMAEFMKHVKINNDASDLAKLGNNFGFADVPLEMAERALAEMSGKFKADGSLYDVVKDLKKSANNAPPSVVADQRVADRRIAQQAVVDEKRLADQRLTFAEYIDKHSGSMTKDEIVNMLKQTATDDVTGLESPYAYWNEKRKAPDGWATVQVDANGLGALNDNFGHPAGDALLKGIGDTIKDALRGGAGNKGRAFRTGGDEIELWIENPEEAGAIADIIDKKFSETVLTFKDNENILHEEKGFSISYGTGKTKTEQEAALNADKARREATGQRATVKGQIAPSIVDARTGESLASRQSKVSQVKGLPVTPIRTKAHEHVPTRARAILEGQEEYLKALSVLEDTTLKRFGLMSDDVMDEGKLAGMAEFEKEIRDNIALAKLTASRVARETRDFALHAYGETTNLDAAAALVLPYHFWYSRTYSGFAKRLVTNADHLAAYAKWKDFMANEYKDSPEWYKYNVRIPDFLGINKGEPYMFNLEASLWPLQGITGVNFDDPEKRTNWFTAFVDDMGKFGPTTFTPLSTAIATYYHIKGEDEIAAKWGSRVIPQTAAIKAISSFFGNPIELDPNVQMFSGDGFLDFEANDPYEEGRISRALSAMGDEGQYTEEQIMEAARTHSGDAWKEAVIRATQDRAPGQLMSTFLGVGFKGRKPSDIQIDNFYADFHRLREMHDNKLVSDAQYREGFDVLREQYPFMDVILLSRKAGMGREEAYAWNVINRVPPGMSEVFEAAGIDPETAQKFYDTGGSMEGMSETERSRFLDAMTDIGATLAIPGESTKKEWDQARKLNKQVSKILQDNFGEDINEKMGDFFSLTEKEEKKRYLAANPKVEQALTMKDGLIASNQTLMKYYGGISTLERYYESKMYDTLEKKFGKETMEASRLYGQTKDKSLIKKHNLGAYWDMKNALEEEALRKIVEFGSKLPEPPAPELRDDLPKDLSPAQKDIVKLAESPPKVTFDQWAQVVGPQISDHIISFWYDKKDLTSYDREELDYLARQYGYYDGDAFLKDILLSLQP